MKGPLNPDLQVGDIIMLLHMEGETSVTPGTVGVVKKITRDPFEGEDENIISVKWENGSILNLITSTDAWKKVSKPEIKEQRDPSDQTWRYMADNADIFEYFDWKWLEKFLYKLRDTGIVNMYGSSQLLYAGSEHIDRYYGEGKEDDEEFQEFLEQADEAIIPEFDNPYYTETPTRAISLMWNQRSVDTFLGLPFNIASYGLLLTLLGKLTNMVPEDLIGNLGDTHLYLNHLDQARQQIERKASELPNLKLKFDFEYRDGYLVAWDKIKFQDIELSNYNPHPAIKAPLSN